MPVIRTENLSHTYSRGTPFERTAIKKINLEIPDGQFAGLIGHTGSGKSTFIQHLNGLLKPTSGNVLYDGRDIHAAKETTRDIRFKVGLVFQYPEYQLFEETVFKDISFGPKNMKLSDAEIKERVYEAARFSGVTEDVMDRSPLELSGGQKRRVALAGVIAMRPSVLILDEPTAGLDPAGRESILQNICDYHSETKSTVLLVTHNMSDIAKIAERLIVFSDGEVAMDGLPTEVFSHSRELREMGLSVPEAASIAMYLRGMGVPVSDGIYTTEQLKDAILALRRGG